MALNVVGQGSTTPYGGVGGALPKRLGWDALQYPGRTLHEEWPQLGPTNNTCLDSVLSITLHDHHPIHPSLPITLQDRLGLAILYYIITIYSNLIYIYIL